MTQNYLYWLDVIGKEHTGLVGKKCANLGEMRKINMPVPQGFSISTKALKTFLKESGAEKAIRSFLRKTGGTLHSIQEYMDVSRALREIVENRQRPAEMRNTIIRYYNDLCDKCDANVAVSVRSAGTVSHPGQYETYLNVKGEAELLRATKKVWSSIYNASTIASLQRDDIPIEHSPAIGVCVLEMVNAQSAGVCFTCDPVTGDRSKMVIEGSWGLGESVVAGDTIPDRHVIDKHSLRIMERFIGDKKTQVVPADDGIEVRETAEDKQSVSCVSDEELLQIAELGLALESHFGTPQDIEWAVSADFAPPHNVFVLQTRPVAGVKKTPKISL